MSETSLLSIGAVFVGGGTGSVLRFLISKLCALFFTGHQWGALAANLLGALLAGFIAVLIFERKVIHPPFTDLFLAGFLGGLTTFSAMLVDAHRLITQNEMAAALLYISLNLILGFLLFLSAFSLAKTV